MSWLPLPFPKCPNCQKSWSLTKHRNCKHKGDLEVNAVREKCRCEYCTGEWNTMNTRFYCSCGYNFTANEVKNAIGKTVELRKKLISLLEEMDFDERKIEQVAKNSVKSWLNKASYEIGRALGTVAGHVVKLISSIFK